MENNEKLKEFFRLVKEARESCAGSNIKPIGLVEAKVRIAKLDAFKLGYGNYEVLLNRAIRLLRKANPDVYGDRLEPDEILCQICNELLEELESK